MSDPVSNAEIEDVLSSIRRLVSQRKGGAAAAESGGDALVLSPSLRVSEEPDPEDAAPKAEPDSLQARVKDLEAAMDRAEGEWEPDGSEEQKLPTEMPARPAAEEATPETESAPLSFRSARDSAPS